MPHTVAEIQLIKLDATADRDKLIWKENKKGVFSVRSAYRVAIHMRQMEQVEHSLAQRDKSLWNRIWQLQVPPKIKMFVWRACSNILPTRTNL